VPDALIKTTPVLGFLPTTIECSFMSPVTLHSFHPLSRPTFFSPQFFLSFGSFFHLMALFSLLRNYIPSSYFAKEWSPPVYCGILPWSLLPEEPPPASFFFPKFVFFPQTRSRVFPSRQSYPFVRPLSGSRAPHASNNLRVRFSLLGKKRLPSLCTPILPPYLSLSLLS